MILCLYLGTRTIEILRFNHSKNIRLGHNVHALFKALKGIFKGLKEKMLVICMCNKGLHLLPFFF